MVVETKSLTKCYGPFVALQDCTISVERSEIFGLLGPNGAGKTTLIRTLMGFLRPTRGSAYIEARNCTTESVRVHETTAYLPGDARLFRRMRGIEVLRFFTDARKDSTFQKAIQIARRLDLDTRRRVAFMSTGMRQKLALAAVLAANASVLILDEPTANLDPNVRSEIMSMLKEAQRAGQTILLSSHVLSEIEESCDRAAILRSGELVHTQALRDLRKKHRITGRLNGPMTPPPPALASNVSVAPSPDSSRVTICTDGDLGPSLEWLLALNLTDIRIEPLGLRTIYDEFHAVKASESDSTVSS